MTYEATPHINMNPAAHYGQQWKDVVCLAPLTDRKITERMKQGYYGKQRQLIALKKTQSSTGFIDRCKCGETLGVRFYKFKYLEQPSFYCPACLEQQRLTRSTREAKEKELARRVRTVDISEFV